MEVVVEALSSTRKAVSLSFSPDEINAILDAEINAYRKSLAIPGFRKGKVPASTVEQRFGDEIRVRATQDKLRDAIDDALKNNNLDPVSKLDADYSTLFTRNEGFACKVTFDVLPEIEFPVYEGLEVNQDKVEVTEEDITAMLNRLRENYGDMVNVTEDRAPQDGDAAVVDYEGSDEQGQPIADVKGQNFTVKLGQGQVLPGFEALIKSAKVGEEKEGPVVFPEDYGHAPLAGKTVIFKIKLNALRETILPELNDELAQKAGQENLETLRKAIEEHLQSQKSQAARGQAMQTLLDGLLSQVTFELPEKMVADRTQRMISERAGRLQRMGKATDLKAQDELREEAKAEAEEALRPQVFLMALAQKEKLSVSEQEIQMAVYSISMRAGQDFKQTLDSYQRSGFIHELRDRILADKGMEFVYSKAKINEVAPQEGQDTATV